MALKGVKEFFTKINYERSANAKLSLYTDVLRVRYCHQPVGLAIFAVYLCQDERVPNIN